MFAAASLSKTNSVQVLADYLSDLFPSANVEVSGDYDKTIKIVGSDWQINQAKKIMEGFRRGWNLGIEEHKRNVQSKPFGK
jgi:hypothetical protein